MDTWFAIARLLIDTIGVNGFIGFIAGAITIILLGKAKRIIFLIVGIVIVLFIAIWITVAFTSPIYAQQLTDQTTNIINNTVSGNGWSSI